MALESALAEDINHPNFIPYIQLHEFEAFLCVEPEKLLVMYPDSKTKIQKLKKSIEYMNPEEINELPESAPSKRIIKYLPDYEKQKAQVGPLVAQEIGINSLRNNCPHFKSWLEKLDSL